MEICNIMFKNKNFGMSQKAVLMFTDKESPYPHPLDVLNHLLVSAQEEFILCVDQSTETSELENLLRTASAEMVQYYNPGTSFSIAPIDLSLCMSDARKDAIKFLNDDQVKLNCALGRIEEYKTLFKTLEFSKPYLIALVPIENNKQIPPIVIGAFVCEYDAYQNLHSMLGQDEKHTIH